MQSRNLRKNIFVLDFDGVLCDSAAETGVSAWRTYCRLWKTCKESEPPVSHLSRFVRLRPLVEKGCDAVLLMYMICNIPHDEIIWNQFFLLQKSILQEKDITPEELGELFGHVRDRWIEEDLSGWLSRHFFYKGVFEKFVLKNETEPIIILTTKQKRFVTILFQSRDVFFPQERIFGLDEGKMKEDILEELQGHGEFSGARFHFVEDRLKTLKRVFERKNLSHIQLYLADWGYNTSQDLKEAKTISGITTWGRAEFLNLPLKY